MQRLIFEYSPLYFVLCIGAGAGYAWLLYSAKANWSPGLNRLLFALRFLLASLLFILLLGPILRRTIYQNEKPTLIFLIDNSESLRGKTDTVKLLQDLRQATASLQAAGRSVEWRTLAGDTDTVTFNMQSSDLAGAIRDALASSEGRNVAGIVLVSDGIYNNGLSPAYLPLHVPVYTVGVGDTTSHPDVVLRNVDYNRIVYQGNKFAVRAEVDLVGLENRDVNIAVYQKGKMVQQQSRNNGTRTTMNIDLQLEAEVQGLQRYDVQVQEVRGETNLANNRATIFVEVVEGKKRILLIAPSPHPDIKALRSVLEKNPNYESMVHIPGVSEAPQEWLRPGKTDLVIAHQSPDLDGRTQNLLQEFSKAKASMLVVIGQRTALRILPSFGIPFQFDLTGQRDEVQTNLNPLFRDLGLPEDLNTQIARFPPVTVPFGKFSFPQNSMAVLFQRIGSVTTERPLLSVVEEGSQKLGVLIGDGIWRWRLNEFQETEKTTAFDELFSRVIQYLATRDDRRKFRCFPIQQEFADDEAVSFETQIYNDLFEPVYGNTVEISLRDEQGTVQGYHYVIGAGNTRYRIGNLKTGVYQYRASTEIKGVKQEVKGEFLVTEQNQESMNLTADFALLRTLAGQTGGKFYKGSAMGRFAEDISKTEMKQVLHSEEVFHPLIDLKWIFFMLLLLVSLEWFIRKYSGSY